MKICPKCKNQTGNDDKNFCHRDGTPLETVPMCECGNKVLATDKFCDVCGKELAVPV